MIFHIPCLKQILFIAVIMFPSAYIFFVKPFLSSTKSKVLNENLSTIAVYGALLLMGIFTGQMGQLLFEAGWMFYGLAILSAPLIILLEYILVSIPLVKKSGKFPKVKPVSIYYGDINLLDIVAIIVAAALEETVFRQFLIGGLLTELEVAGALTVIISGFFYGLNHVYFGRLAVVQKTISGCIFGTLFVISGGNILISIIAHVTQNLVLYSFSVMEWRKKLKIGRSGAEQCIN